MKASHKARKLIQQYEGLRLSAYRCPAGVLTIGYGHTGSDITPGQVITAARAEELFSADLAPIEDRLNAWATAAGISLTQGQFDALCSFAFNLGLNALKGSTLWRKTQADPSDPTIPAEFARWVYANGRRLQGLINRRQAEARLWQS